ncbi:MAG: DUF4276 family protein [Phycisphaerales bacterium]|nr:DUF4276 family protein [Phycisphaerales bacterium]
MIQLRVAPIVEGHGEVSAVPELLRRMGTELLGGAYIDVMRPIRQPRSKLLRRDAASGNIRPDDDAISSAVRLAFSKLAQVRTHNVARSELILVLLDSNGDCAGRLAPSILDSMARATGKRGPVSVVLPVVEYESWFVAAARSLGDLLDVADSDIPASPLDGHYGKAWIEQRFRGGNYSETVDQVRLTACMDLAECRRRARSFDKLCRELGRWMPGCTNKG